MIILKNKSQNKITIASLAIELNPEETTSLDYYNVNALLDNEELNSLYNNGSITFFFNSQEINYSEVKQKISPITKNDHDSVASIRHPDCVSYQEIVKDNNSQITNIIYYSDETKTLKIKEESVIRNEQGKISNFITAIYDNGILLSKETQTIIRNNNKVENIVITRG